MPPRRKTSYEQRRRNNRKAVNKFREKHKDFDRERNRKMLAKRRKDEDYHFEELTKNMTYMRKLRKCIKYKKRREEIAFNRAKEAYLARQEETRFGITERNDISMYIEIKQEDSISVHNESYRDEDDEDELSYSIVKTYGCNENCHFPKLESSEKQLCSTIKQLNKNNNNAGQEITKFGITERNDDVSMYIEIKQENISVCNESYRNEDELSYSIAKTYGCNENCHFPKLESSEKQICSTIKQLNKNNNNAGQEITKFGITERNDDVDVNDAVSMYIGIKQEHIPVRNENNQEDTDNNGQSYR